MDIIESLDMHGSSTPLETKKLFSDFAVGDHAYMDLLVVGIEEAFNKYNKPYLKVSGSDGAQIVIVKKWDTSESQCEFKIGDVIRADIATNAYHDGISFTLNDERILQNADPFAFVKSPPISVSDMWNTMKDWIQGLRYPLDRICEKLVLDNQEAYIHSAAGKSVHHAYIGGLMYHSYRMAIGARTMAKLYEADMDMVTAGALVHDIGKLKELMTDVIGSSEYTVPGQMEHHTLLGIRMLDKAALELDVNPDDENVAMLRHIIASHHGRIEYGAISQPMTREAFIISSQDMLDMQMTVFDDDGAILLPGQMSTPHLGLNGSQMYMPDYSYELED